MKRDANLPAITLTLGFVSQVSAVEPYVKVVEEGKWGDWEGRPDPFPRKFPWKLVQLPPLIFL